MAGSYGKTSTKELTATILGARWNVLRPPGSYNTPMGISRVIREQLTPAHELFVAELGDYVPGDVRFLCDLVRPTIGILTTIGPEHLERFKTMERIVQTKEELIDALPPDGVAVVNQDDPLVRAIGDRAAARGLRVVRYGQTEPGVDVRARDVQTTRDGLSFTVVADGHGEARFQIGLLGRHNVMNVLAATSAALALGMSLPEIAAAARQIRPVEHRLEPIHGAGGVLVIDDTYNSNPRGAAEALTVLGDLPGGKKILVTPGMIELAERQFEEHFRLGKRAAAVCDEVILVGPERTRPIAEGLHAAGFPSDRVHLAMGRDAATAQLGRLLRAGDVVLWENDLPDTYAEETGAARHAISQPPLPRREGVRPTLRTSLRRRWAPHHRASHPPTCGGGGRGWEETTVDGLRIAYREEGPTDAPPVVVLHGWGASIAAVASIQSVLSRTHRTVAIDLPGIRRQRPATGTLELSGVRRAAASVSWRSVASVERASSGTRSAASSRSSWPPRARRWSKSWCSSTARASARSVEPPTTPGCTHSRPVGACWRNSPLNGTIGGSAPAAFRFQIRVGRLPPGRLDARHAGPGRQRGSPSPAASDRRSDAADLGRARRLDSPVRRSPDGAAHPDAGLVVFPGAGHFAYADDFDRFARVVGHFLATRQESG